MNTRKTSVRAGAAVLGAAAVAGVAWIAIPAEAATTGNATVVGGTIPTLTAGSGRANTVVVTRPATNVVTFDDVTAITPGRGCYREGSDVTKISCTTGTKAAVWIRVDLGDGNDTLYNRTGLGMTAWGRAGNDKITGGPLRDDVYGGDGNDAIWGLAGNDTLRGEAGVDAVSGGDGDDELTDGTGNDKVLGGIGDDVIINDQGNDVFDAGDGDDVMASVVDFAAGTDRDSFTGGAGIDLVDYSMRKKAITADADGVGGDDGSTGEGDTISSTVEGIAGGSGADRLIGTARTDVFFGGAGNDVIAASTANDYLEGEAGKDYLNGAGGDDVCVRDSGDTVLSCERDGSEEISTLKTHSADTKLVKVLKELHASRK